MKLVLTFFILLRFLMKCDALPEGAPLAACEDLTPFHDGGRIKPSETRSPYFVSAVPMGNNTVKVTISSLTEDFRGFLLQARSKEDPTKFVNGQFTVTTPTRAEGLQPRSLKDTTETENEPFINPETKTIDCFNKLKNTLTHVNATLKRAVVTEWTPDPDVNEDVVFRATVAKNYYTFWTGLDSQPVSISNGAVVDTPDNKATDVLYEGCFLTKGCIGLPKDCAQSSEDCQVLLTYYSVPSGVQFSMHGRLNSQTYMAMGLSEDDKMGDDSVNECIRDQSDVIARESWNERDSNTLTKDLPESDYHSNFVNGLSSCSWVKPYNFESAGGKEVDLNYNNYHILLATGKVTNGRLKHHSEKIASDEALNFTIFEMYEGNDSDFKIDGNQKEATTLIESTTTEIHENITTSSSSTEESTSSSSIEESKSQSSQLSFNIFCVILTLLFSSKLFVFLQV